jgi:YfiH family protein
VITREMPGARVVFTDRHGGVSTGPYASANLGSHVGDDPSAVAENRRRAAATACVAPPDGWVALEQVHGHAVARCDEPPPVAPVADAAVTTATGVPLVVVVADCAPIALVADHAVAAVHAGWPGLEQGVIEAAVTELRRASTGEIHAVLGPCIHPERYEFGADLLERLVARLGDAIVGRTDAGTLALDIPAAVRISLANAGVDRFDDVGECTAASPDYFSYRRDGPTGRQAMFVVREP